MVSPRLEGPCKSTNILVGLQGLFLPTGALAKEGIGRNMKINMKYYSIEGVRPCVGGEQLIVSN